MDGDVRQCRTAVSDMTVKNNGKVLFKLSYSVSADGKTLTENGTATGPDEKTTIVYDRQ